MAYKQAMRGIQPMCLAHSWSTESAVSETDACAISAMRRDVRRMILEAFATCSAMQEVTCSELCRSIDLRLNGGFYTEASAKDPSIEELVASVCGPAPQTVSAASQTVSFESVALVEEKMPEVAGFAVAATGAETVVADSTVHNLPVHNAVRGHQSDPGKTNDHGNSSRFNSPKAVGPVSGPRMAAVGFCDSLASSKSDSPPEPKEIPPELPGTIPWEPQSPLSMTNCISKTLADRPFGRSVSPPRLSQGPSVVDTPSALFKTALENRWQALAQQLMNQMDPNMTTTHAAWRPYKTKGGSICTFVSKARMIAKFMERHGKISMSWDTANDDDQGGTRWVLHPHSPQRVIWDSVGIMMCAYEVWLFPMQTTFTLDPAFADLRLYVDHLAAVFWLCDLGVTFLSGYNTTEGFVEMRPRVIARRYFTTWFAMDLAVVIVDFFTLLSNLVLESGSMRVGKTVTRLLRSIRVFRILKARERLVEVFGMVRSEILFAVLQVAKPLGLTLGIGHYAACAWYGISIMEDNQANTWTQREHWVNFDPHPTSEAYAASIHWVLAQLTFGTSNFVGAQTRHERYFACLILLIGLFSFSYISAAFSQAMTQLNAADRLTEEESAVRRYLVENKIPRTLSARVHRFLRKQHGLSHRRRIELKDIECFRMLPKHIKDPLVERAYSIRLAVHPVFASLRLLEQEAMQTIYMTGLEERFLLPGDEVFGHKEPIDRMLFVLTGSLCYEYSKDMRNWNGEVDDCTDVVKPGEFCCEVALWAQDAKLAGPLVARPGPCQIICVNADIFRCAARRSFSISTLRFLSSYADRFVHDFNDAGRDQDALVEWRSSLSSRGCGAAAPRVTLLFNDRAMTRQMTIDAAEASSADPTVLAKIHFALQEEKQHVRFLGKRSL